MFTGPESAVLAGALGGPCTVMEYSFLPS